MRTYQISKVLTNGTLRRTIRDTMFLLDLERNRYKEEEVQGIPIDVPEPHIDMEPFEMKEIENGDVVVCFPGNCYHPNIFPPVDCKAFHKSNQDCGCRFCVWNKFFNQANSNINHEEEQSEE